MHTTKELIKLQLGYHIVVISSHSPLIFNWIHYHTYTISLHNHYVGTSQECIPQHISWNTNFIS